MDKTDFVRSEECEGYPGIAADYENMRQINHELVAALESALEYLAPSKGFADLDRAVFVIRAALAKAKGEM